MVWSKEKRREYKKEYYHKNKEKIREYNKEYYHKNKEKIREYKKEYYHKNKKKIREYEKEKRRIWETMPHVKKLELMNEYAKKILYEEA